MNFKATNCKRTPNNKHNLPSNPLAQFFCKLFHSFWVLAVNFDVLYNEFFSRACMFFYTFLNIHTALLATPLFLF